jgi:hypothetical protein
VRRLAIAVAFVGVLWAAAPAQAVTTFFTGAVSSDWNTAGNWTNGVPTAETDASVPSFGDVSLTNGPPGIANSLIAVNVSTVRVSGTTLTLDGGAPSSISGHLSVTAGTVMLAGATSSFGNWTLSGGAVVNTGTLTLTGGGIPGIVQGSGPSQVVNRPGATINKVGASALAIGVPLWTSGTVNVLEGTTEVGAGATITGGTVNVASGASFGTAGQSLTLWGGVVGGSGELRGTVANMGGTIAPGASPGRLSITGDYVQGAGGTLQAELNGPAAGAGYDQLAVSGSATLGGALALVNAPGHDPPVGGVFDVVTAGALGGAFATVSGTQLPAKHYVASYPAGLARLTVNATPSPPNVPPPPAPPPPPPPSSTTRTVPIAQIATVPASTRCVSRRLLRIRLRAPAGQTLTRANIYVDAKRVKLVTGARLSSRIELRSLPRSGFRLRIVVTLKSGRRLQGSRRYRTCARRT